MIDLASEAFDIVVLDLASGVGPLTQAMLDRCDNVVVVVDATPSGLAAYAVSPRLPALGAGA